MQDSIFSKLEVALDSEDYTVEEVRAAYVSKEYLGELAYNSFPNVYFGYTLAELESQFGETPYIFLPDEDGKTIVKTSTEYDDSFDQVTRNVAIGGGVILVCVVLTAATGGVGLPAVSAVFAFSAKSAAAGVLSMGVFDGAISGIATGMKTGNLEESLKAAAVSGSEGFKWGAIVGAATGGGGKLLSQAKNARVARSWRESEIAVRELYKGEEQVAYQGGKVVSRTKKGSTRPDVVATVNGKRTAIEVKNYDLINNFGGLKTTFKKELSQRLVDLPDGMPQMVVVDVKGKGYTKAFVEARMLELEAFVKEIDPSIVVEVLR